MTSPTQTFGSSNYPNHYNHARVCTWTIMGREGTNILLTVSQSDYLSIHCLLKKMLKAILFAPYNVAKIYLSG